MNRHNLSFCIHAVFVGHLLAILGNRIVVFISLESLLLLLNNSLLLLCRLRRRNSFILRLSYLYRQRHYNLNKVVQVVVIVSYCWLLISALPLTVDNKLEKMVSRANLIRSLKKKLKLVV